MVESPKKTPHDRTRKRHVAFSNSKPTVLSGKSEIQVPQHNKKIKKEGILFFAIKGFKKEKIEYSTRE